jgi:hypothetical protein
MGCYPLFSCLDWSQLRKDLEELDSELVSLALVTDPFSAIDGRHLAQYFDVVKPFKTHYVVDLSYSLKSFVHKVHSYNARRSLKRMDVEVCLDPARYLDDWMKLYQTLIKRHHITGMSAFSRECFEMQLQIPGAILVIGRANREVIGANLIIMQSDIAYGHLAAFSPEGYRIKASYGIFWTALTYLADHHVRFYDMGGGAGTKENPEDGLSTFKANWSNVRRMTYLCGRIINNERYQDIVRSKGKGSRNYFPAYRDGEFESDREESS